MNRPANSAPTRNTRTWLALVGTLSASLVAAVSCSNAEDPPAGTVTAFNDPAGSSPTNGTDGPAGQTGGVESTNPGQASPTGGNASSGTESNVNATSPLSGNTTVGATGGSDGVPAPEPCEDLEPPPDPEWPGATCASWATETEECGAAWFSNFCDLSCGRCTPVGGAATPAEPEPERCEDLEPPPDPEWPGVTCREWALETEECEADWFAEYCDVSCGRCVPEGGPPPGTTAPDCSGEDLPNVSGGEGFATRYWDCCQTHCGQFNGQRCSRDGVSITGDGNSSCNGGGSFACYSEAPYAVSDCLSYGHVAKASADCGNCYRIQFTGEGEHSATDAGSMLIAGKQMIVKVSNTGGDVAGNQFDLMIPGGGVGLFNACSNQWGTDDLGAQYGGFLTACTAGSHAARKECVRQECLKIPAGDARDGCFWFVDWLQVADNPKFTSEQTPCPF